MISPMAFVLRTTLTLTQFPALGEMLRSLTQSFGTEACLDQDADRALKRGARSASWCPWPLRTIGLYLEGASTRGTEIDLSRVTDGIEVRLTQHTLGTWSDWRLTLEAAMLLADRADGYVTLQGGGRVATTSLRRRYIEETDQYEAELQAGLRAVRLAVEEQGRTLRLGGPRGVAAVGPITWERVLALGGEEPEDQAEALVDAILASLEARGFEEFYPANLLCLDGRTGKEVLASLLPPGVDTLLRDPEYVLMSRNLEAGPEEPLLLLPFDAMEAAFPGRLHWLDDRTCAVPAIDPAGWSVHIQRIEPMLTSLTELLDGTAEDDPEAWRRFVPDQDPDGGTGSRQP
jgi:hypothetical protein